MKISEFSSKVVKRAVKTFIASSVVLVYFIYNDFNHLYDIIFPAVFLVLIFKYFAVED